MDSHINHLASDSPTSLIDTHYLYLTSVLNGILNPGSKFENQVINNAFLNHPGIIEQIEVHGIAPLFYTFYKHHSQCIDEISLRQLKALAFRHKQAAKIRHHVLVDIIEKLAAANIKIILLKGAALANMIYAEPRLRPMRDIDILVSKSHQKRVKQILETYGFVFDTHYSSIFMGDSHHLPNAVKDVQGFAVSLELHHDIYSRDLTDSLVYEQIIGPAQKVEINGGTTAYTLNHYDMLNHLCRHTFSHGREVRLIHQFDIIQYCQHFKDELRLEEISIEQPFIYNTLRCLQYSLRFPDCIREKIGAPESVPPGGIGQTMLPYQSILKDKKDFFSRLNALLFPSAWWLHVYYNVPPEKSLIWCYIYKHPVKIFTNIRKRLFEALKFKLKRSKHAV